MLVVGQEEAGKTALCHALSGHRCADHAQMTEASTVGIDTVRWSTVVAIPRTNRSTTGTHTDTCIISLTCTHGILVATLVTHRAR